MNKSSKKKFKPLPNPDLMQEAIVFAEVLHKKSAVLKTPREQKQLKLLTKMLQNQNDKHLVTAITDQIFRSSNDVRSLNQLRYIFNEKGMFQFVGNLPGTLISLLVGIGAVIPRLFISTFKAALFKETANVIAPGEKEGLSGTLQNLYKDQVRVNVNSLGEMLLGEKEAKERLQSYMHLLENPEIEVISIKISTLYSQISLIAKDYTLAKLSDRLAVLYRHSLKHTFTKPDGSKVNKLIYLDMEEYQDLHVTVKLFIHTLSKPEFKTVSGGIVLQAYIPDSYTVLTELTRWGIDRVKKGGAPITVRIVKGANLEMERVHASEKGFPLPIFKSKIETDANYKKMLGYALTPEHSNAVRIGIASHNLFEIAFGVLLAKQNGVMHRVQFEMLEGMANHQRRALMKYVDSLLLYLPSTPKESFLNAIGYLIRRLDENTGEENFLRYNFNLTPHSPPWNFLKQHFEESYKLINTLPASPRRTQNRNLAPSTPNRSTEPEDFNNEPDTDFSLPHNVAWAEGIVLKWKKLSAKPVSVPMSIAGKDVRVVGKVAKTTKTKKKSTNARELHLSYDPSVPGKVVTVYESPTAKEIEQAIVCAVRDPKGWRKTNFKKRFEILQKAVQEFKIHRGDLIGVAVVECGKIVTQSDPEISEAIDFIDYYIRTAKRWEELPGLKSSPVGVVAVIPPWNFPIAIPCGGIAAGLAAGNTVIIKPSPEAVQCARMVCECFWKAGVPKQALQFLPGPGKAVGGTLSRDPRINAVVFTGGTATALAILDHKPQVHLLAETGGKNATIVSAMSDRELAIKHVIQSAFGHSGQKCSATSLLVLEREVYEDPKFKSMLIDATGSLKVGSTWELETVINPLIREPNDTLHKGLTTLEPGEEWALKPQIIDNNPKLWSPGIKWGVKPGSFSHLNEFFGPVLSVMVATNLNEAINIVNATGYGLTSGLETLDEREKTIWRSRIRAGNLYINRPTTGAIVLRQPFGGIGKSAFGPGIKAGGPNYLAQLYNFEMNHTTKSREKKLRSVSVSTDTSNILGTRGALTQSLSGKLPLPYLPLTELLSKLTTTQSLPDNEIKIISEYTLKATELAKEEFQRLHDNFKLIGQDNFRSYHPVQNLCIRLLPGDHALGIYLRIISAWIAGGNITVSYPKELMGELNEKFYFSTLSPLTEGKSERFQSKIESDEELIKRIRNPKRTIDRLRFDGANKKNLINENIFRAATEQYIYLVRVPVLPAPRLELLWYVYEQSLAHDYHRYGNLGTRTEEERRVVL